MSTRRLLNTRLPAQSLLAIAAFLVVSVLAAACGNNAETGAGDGGGHDHDALFEVPTDATAPTIEIELIPDPMQGYNLLIETTNYEVAPEKASTEAVFGEGHFHLYIDGEKTARFYNPALHLGDLTPGPHEVTVELSANDHSTYAVDGAKIQHTIAIDVPEPSEEMAMGHKTHELIAISGAKPTLDLSVSADPKSGWNVEAAVENFTFTPRETGGEPVDGEGHLHLYVDGAKIGRLYGPWWHIPALSEGSHDIMVELTANDHSPWSVDDEPIRAMATVEVSAEQASDVAMQSTGEHSEGKHDHSMATASTLDIPAAYADVVIEAAIVDGAVTIDRGNDRIEVDEGQSVGITITSDVAETLHVHGFDVFLPLDEGATSEVAFAVDQSGLFEVELEDSGTFVFELLVR